MTTVETGEPLRRYWIGPVAQSVASRLSERLPSSEKSRAGGMKRVMAVLGTKPPMEAIWAETMALRVSRPDPDRTPLQAFYTA